jgi:hypothetical protein
VIARALLFASVAGALFSAVPAVAEPTARVACTNMEDGRTLYDHQDIDALVWARQGFRLISKTPRGPGQAVCTIGPEDAITRRCGEEAHRKMPHGASGSYWGNLFDACMRRHGTLY